MNLDPTHWPDDPAVPLITCAQAGFTSVRYALDLRRTYDLHTRFEDAARSLNIRPLRVLARESFGMEEWAAGLYRYRVATWRDHLGSEADWEAGNEPEAGGGESSATMTPDHYGRLLEETRIAVGPGAFIVSGGLVGGNPDWVRDPAIWDRLRGCCNAFGHHLYEMSPYPEAPGMLPFAERQLRYWIPAARTVALDLSLPLYITEIGAGRGFFLTDELLATFLLRSFSLLAPHVEAIWPFCFDTVMVTNYGLRDHGIPTKTWDVCAQYARAQGATQPVPLPNPVKEAPMEIHTIEDFFFEHPELKDQAGPITVSAEFVESGQPYHGGLEHVRHCRLWDGSVLEQTYSPLSQKQEVWRLAPKA